MNPKRVTAGEPFRPSASAWNALSDFVRQHQGGRTGAGPGLGGDPSTLVVLVRNDTGGDLAARAVLTPGAPVLSAVDRPHQVQAEPYFAADAPAASGDQVCVTLGPIKDGAVGRAVVAGVAVVDVDVTDAAHAFAAPIAGDTAKLASAASGAVKVIHKEAGTGVKRATVLIGGLGGGPGGGDTHGAGFSYSTALQATPPVTFWPSSGPGVTSRTGQAVFATFDTWALLMNVGPANIGTNHLGCWFGVAAYPLGEPGEPHAFPPPQIRIFARSQLIHTYYEIGDDYALDRLNLKPHLSVITPADLFPDAPRFQLTPIAYDPTPQSQIVTFNINTGFGMTGNFTGPSGL